MKAIKGISKYKWESIDFPNYMDMLPFININNSKAVLKVSLLSHPFIDEFMTTSGKLITRKGN